MSSKKKEGTSKERLRRCLEQGIGRTEVMDVEQEQVCSPLKSSDIKNKSALLNERWKGESARLVRTSSERG